MSIYKSKKVKCKKHPSRLDLLDKWEGYSREELEKLEEKWSDFLWLGRELFVLEKGRIPEKLLQGVFETINNMINKYRNDEDFVRCMVSPKSKNGDKEWEEITKNVGSLRLKLYGQWNTDS